MHEEYLLLHVMSALMHVDALVGVTISVIMCICMHVCVAPPIVMGAWPMAGTLWWLFVSTITIHLEFRGIML